MTEKTGRSFGANWQMRQLVRLRGLDTAGLVYILKTRKVYGTYASGSSRGPC